jgi:hypothetical protein
MGQMNQPPPPTPDIMSLEYNLTHGLGSSEESAMSEISVTFRNTLIYNKRGLLASHPSPKMEDHLLLFPCLLINISAVVL